jgi:hypothetical protein
MIQNKPRQFSLRIILFLISFWLLGVIFAFFFGLGWFFLIESFRRLLTYIPPINRKLQNYYINEVGQPKTENNVVDPKLILLSNIFRLIILFGWIGMTIFVFAKMNIPLISIFQPAKP